MKLPYPKNPIVDSEFNITYHELRKMSDEETKTFFIGLRKELLRIWDETSTPPSIGKSENDIEDGFSQLKEIDHIRLFEDKNYPDHIGFIIDWTQQWNGLNQFFPHMLKTRINKKSMYDWFSNDDLSVEFRRVMVRALKNDGMYSFTKFIKVINQISFHQGDSDYAQTQNKNITKTELYRTFRYKLKEDEDFFVPPNGQIRVYDKTEKLFPKIIQVFRLGLGQPPVNFKPITARVIYEKYLSHITSQESYTIYDPCSGWGGRLLGSLCSKLKLHYVGTDPNTNNFGCYEKLGEFYNKKCNGTNTYEIFREPAEEIGNNIEFQKYVGNIDLIFTSPPYFDREQYSEDKTQSMNKFKDYSDWYYGFLRKMIFDSYDQLKVDRYMILNIADIRRGELDYIPLEQDTISLATERGFEYIGKIEMGMTRMIGVNPQKVKNSWFDEETKTDYKTEPILVFFKSVDYPWVEETEDEVRGYSLDNI